MSIEVSVRIWDRLRHDGADPTHLYLVRHGQTAGNVSHQLIGHTDMPLDDLGLDQARQVGLHMRAVRLDAVITSPLARARVTASEIARHQAIELQVDDRLKEMHFGDAEGLTMPEAAERFPHILRLRDDPLAMEFRWPSGEHRAEFHSRVLATFTELAAIHHGRQVAVVCHGGVITSLIAQLDGGSPNDYNRYPVANCSVTHLEVHTHGTTAHRLNDFAHLDIVRTEPWTYTIPGDSDANDDRGGHETV